MDLIRFRNLRFVYHVLNLLLIMSLGIACTRANQSSPQVESIGQIAAAATSARQGVLLVQKYVSDENSWEYTEARKLYGEAQSAFNGWIEQLKADIVFEVEPSTEKYDAALADAIQKTENFLKHVEQIQQVNVSTGVGSSDNVENNSSERDDVSTILIVSIATQIVKDVVVGAGIEYWKTSKELQSQAQEKNLKYLDTLLWESFEDIK